MRGKLRQRLGKVEIIGKLGALRRLAVAHLGGEAAALPIGFAQRAQEFRIFGKALDQNGACALQRRLRRGDVLLRIHEGGGCLLRLAGGLGEEQIGQGLQARLFGDLRLGAALGLVGQVEVFEPRLGVGGVELERQLVGELALLADAVEDRLAPVLQLAQVAQALLQGAQLGIVQGAGDFLAVARDEGNGGTAVEQIDGRLDLPFLHTQFVRNALTDG